MDKIVIPRNGVTRVSLLKILGIALETDCLPNREAHAAMLQNLIGNAPRAGSTDVGQSMKSILLSVAQKDQNQ